MPSLPTYRLEPKVPLNEETCRNVIKSVMHKAFENDPILDHHSADLSVQLSEEIKDRIKEQNYDRYRYVCVVTVGEKARQGYCSLANFLWNKENDGYITYVIETSESFAVATLYYIYCD